MKTIAVFLLFTISIWSQGQFVEEATYDNENAIHHALYMVTLEVDGMKYAQQISGLEDQRFIHLYNLDHTLWKSIDLNGLPTDTIGSQPYFYDVLYITQHLFDLDDEVECMFVLYQDPYLTAIVNEDGTIMAAYPEMYPGVYIHAPQVQYPIYNTPNGTKMILGNVYEHYSKVYGLPGTYPDFDNPVVEFEENESKNSTAYPNPTSNSIRIDYTLPPGASTAELKIFDMQGNLVKSVKVGNAFDHVLLDLSALAPGTYLYQVGDQPAQQLVKL